jgi:uncharacterized protein (DUF2235 family)
VAVAKNIVLLSDGTGNAASSIWRTNVWRFFQSLDLTEKSQVACYDDGVGTSSFRPLAILGGAFGWGLKRNVIRLYEFLCRNYEDDAQIFAVGFSRGAFTARVLAGLIANQGLVTFETEAELHRKSKLAFQAYRKEKYHRWHQIGTLLLLPVTLVGEGWRKFRSQQYDKSENIQVEKIQFLGVWDTVAAYGLPMDEMTRGVSLFIWPLELPDRTLSSKIQKACHALALDDERTTFHPVLWTEENENTISPEKGVANIKDERISQVWFAGAHANVGGGYPDDSLARIPLYWMMQQAKACGLRFKPEPDANPDTIVGAKLYQDKDGRLYDSRNGLGGYYRYGPRNVDELAHMDFSIVHENKVRIENPKIHVSVLERLTNGAHIYAPLGLPTTYSVVGEDGSITPHSSNGFEDDRQSQGRRKEQERVWNLVWLRRMVYFATLVASFHLLLFPLLHQTNRAYELSSGLRPLSEVLRLTATFLPGIANWWIGAFATNPGYFLLGALSLGALMGVGSALGVKIADLMNCIWNNRAPKPSWYQRAFDSGIGAYRHWCLRHVILVGFKRYVFPFIFAISFVYLTLALASHISFNFFDANGYYCKDSATTHNLLPNEERNLTFNAQSFCQATGLSFEQGYRYSVTLVRGVEWRDGNYEAGITGYEISELPTWHMRFIRFAMLPLRRVFLREWFRPIARIGSTGNDEYFIDPENRTGLQDPQELRVNSVFTARKDGELFLYVNDAAIGLPWFYDAFYSRNNGTADVIVKRLPRQ